MRLSILVAALLLPAAVLAQEASPAAELEAALARFVQVNTPALPHRDEAAGITTLALRAEGTVLTSELTIGEHHFMDGFNAGQYRIIQLHRATCASNPFQKAVTDAGGTLVYRYTTEGFRRTFEVMIDRDSCRAP